MAKGKWTPMYLWPSVASPGFGLLVLMKESLNAAADMLCVIFQTVASLHMTSQIGALSRWRAVNWRQVLKQPETNWHQPPTLQRC